MTSLLKAGIAGLVAALMAGCASKRGSYPVPEVSLPSQFKNAPAEEEKKDKAAEGSDGAQSPQSLVPPLPKPVAEAGMVEWWRYFGNRELEDLVDRAMANNADMRIATLHIAQAKARADEAAAGKLPTVSAPILAAIQAPGSSSAGTVPTDSSGSSSSGSSSSSQKYFQASIKAEWRLDVWGERSALAESAALSVWRAAFERDNVQRNLAATLASNYLEYAALNDRLRVAREADAVLNATLTTIEKRVQAGDATLGELEQQRAAIFALRATIPTLEQQREDVANAIAFLVGTVPSKLQLSDNGLDSLNLPSVVPGVPSSLLLRRPDVRMAEARLLSANADIDVARARILPPIDLSAQTGYSSSSLSQLFLPKAFFWNAVSSLTVSIFDGGVRSREKDYAQAVHEEMVETYVRTLYQAMRETESALATIRLAERRLGAHQDTIAAAKRAWDINTKIYGVGGIDYLSLLETERNYHRYLDDYQRVKVDYYKGYVNLFLSLGGGVKANLAALGKGSPTAVPDGAPAITSGKAASRGVQSAGGVDFSAGQVENFWQVELAGLYHRSTIGAAWRDLRNRYPAVMEGRMLRPRLDGRIDDAADGQEAWYRLYVAKFDTPEAALAFCATLRDDQQRCRVTSSRSDETVEPETGRKGAGAVAVAKTETPAALKPETVADATPETASAGETAPVAAPVQIAATAEVPAAADNPAPLAIGAPTRTISRDRPRVADTNAAAAASAAVRERLAYTVQLGAFSNRENAALSKAFWQRKGYEVFVAESRDAGSRAPYAVRTGVYPTRREALLAATGIRNKEDAPAVAVPILVDRQGKPATLELGDPVAADVKTLAPAVPELPEALPADKASAEAQAYAVQLGAFAAAENAKLAQEFWRNKGYEVYVDEISDADGRRWFAVRSGRYLQRQAAVAAAGAFGQGEGTPAVVVPLLDGSARAASVSGAETPAGASSAGVAAAAAPAETQAPTAMTAAAATSGAAPRQRLIYTLQLASFASRDNAAKILPRWREKGYAPYVAEYQDAAGRLRYAVRSGEYRKRGEALAAQRAFLRSEHSRVLLVPLLVEEASSAKVELSQAEVAQ